MKSNLYLVVYKKENRKQLKEDTLFKCFIVDATKDEQSASIHQISHSFDNDPKIMKMQKEYPYCYSSFIDLGKVWAFRLEYAN